MHYLQFVSASEKHILWMKAKLFKKTDCTGHISKGKNSSVYQLRYAKHESLKILKKMYYTNTVLCLSRKKDKINKALNSRY